jgi:hypothetical protein
MPSRSNLPDRFAFQGIRLADDGSQPLGLRAPEIAQVDLMVLASRLAASFPSQQCDRRATGRPFCRDLVVGEALSVAKLDRSSTRA